MDIIFPFPVLHIQKLESGIYALEITEGGHQIYEDAGLASIEDCLQQASNGLLGAVHALEIRYRSVGVGTVSVTTIYHSRQSVAQQIVSRYAEVMDGIGH